MWIPMQITARDSDVLQFEAEMDLPYGTYDCCLVYRTAGAMEDDEAFQWKECGEKFKEFTHHCEPKPISRKDQ